MVKTLQPRNSKASLSTRRSQRIQQSSQLTSNNNNFNKEHGSSSSCCCRGSCLYRHCVLPCQRLIPLQLHNSVRLALVAILCTISCILGVQLAQHHHQQQQQHREFFPTSNHNDNAINSRPSNTEIPVQGENVGAAAAAATAISKDAVQSHPPPLESSAQTLSASISTSTTTSTTTSSTPITRKPLLTPAEMGEIASTPINPSLPFPIFSFTLPHSGMAILPRYVDCATQHAATAATSDNNNKKYHWDTTNTFGRYWTRVGNIYTPGRRPIGWCLWRTFRSPQALSEQCGTYDVWHDLQYLEVPHWKHPQPQGHCFDPVWYPHALTKLHHAHPQATILVFQRNPADWYASKSFDLHERWNEWCNPTHNHVFPQHDTLEDYVTFYHNYHQRIRQFVTSHPGWTLVEIDLDASNNKKIAQQLHTQLGIAPPQCWNEALQDRIPTSVIAASNVDHHPNNPQVSSTAGAISSTLRRPIDITYPILVVSLPQSGTKVVGSYFNCQLGDWQSAQEWIKYKASASFQDGFIWECMRDNVVQPQDNKPPLNDCGYARAYSDIGLVHEGRNICWYPQLHHDNALEAFAKAYPRATILLTLHNSTVWASATRELQAKWSNTPACQQYQQQAEQAPPPKQSQQQAQHHQNFSSITRFPLPGAAPSAWAKFYDEHTQRMRQFARDHPDLTYIEVPATDGAGAILNNIFGFQKGCWGSENVDPNQQHY